MTDLPRKKVDLLNTKLNQQIVLLVFAIFGVILALSWSDAIRSLVLETLKLDGDSLRGKLAYALIATVITAGLIFFFVLLLRAAVEAKIEKS
uniref:Transmembrane protein n=1 Tax=Pithovirus LCPAC201 TaxID=2506591 RepID=A0A481Z6P1_9VIRU|nr:MAG: hypothetical protein LCPAC201_01000 [Pithovirus LCPAC201]